MVQLSQLWNKYTRCLAFLVIEGAFFALAAYLQVKEVRLPYRLPGFLSRFNTTSLVKGAIVILFNVWHGTAVACVVNILNDAYSREWKVRRNMQKGDVEGVDSVSIITSGLLDRLKYLGSEFVRASPTFKLACITSLWLASLQHAGSAAIVVGDGTEARRISAGGLLFGSSQLSYNIMTMERVLGLGLGYETQENWIIPKPATNASRGGGSLAYKSDIIYFNHSCQWHVPQFNNVSPVGGRVTIGGEDFDFRLFKSPPNGSTLDTTFGTAFYPVRPYLAATNATSAFLVFGGNSSFPLNSDPLAGNPSTPLNVIGSRAPRNTIDLSGLPTVYNASWFNFSAGRFRTSDGLGFLTLRAPLATALLCDAHPTLTTGTVNVTSNHLGIESFGGTPSVGNLNASDIPRYFSLALDGLISPDSNAYIDVPSPLGGTDPLLVDVTPLASFLLLSQVGSGSWVNGSNPPLSLDQIGRNVDALVLSSSKAQRVDGIGYSNLDIPQGSGSMVLDATGPTLNQVLVSNQIWFSVTALIALVTLLLCFYIALRIDKENHPPFDLDHINPLPPWP
ncbi:hypothetical protein D9756_009882 [Leucocoprinus leucothites]|uniref:Uncharacterized protein n=1 Tax=Leucocoprinus leucothites TaxID=201217 RepID=A0A8H5CTH0_9AGAR|nr:hypothetical protein D9756_009882 [Leucoagaricus leucothites]